MSVPPDHAWLYFQLFLQRQTESGATRPELAAVFDHLLTPHVENWVETLQQRGWIRRFFFIRYAEGGYHLRLRVQGEPYTLATHVRPYLRERMSDFFRAQAGVLGLDTGEISAENLTTAGYLQEAAYEPEWDKYGGPLGIPLAESHFQVSSQVCFHVLAAERQTRIPRAQYALDCLRALLAAYSADPLEQAFILRAYTGYWIAHLLDAARADMLALFEQNYQRKQAHLHTRLRSPLPTQLELQWPLPIPNGLQRWRNHLTQHIPQLGRLERRGLIPSPLTEHVRRQAELLAPYPTLATTPTVGLLILPNYLHMFNNRLGLTAIQEIQLTYLLYRHIEDSSGQTTAAYALHLEPALADLSPLGV